MGLNEAKTYTLVSPEMSNLFKYEEKENITLPNPMSVDKSVIRTTLIPSLLNVYEYNKARKLNDIMLYEISKTYDKNYIEDSKIAILMKGNYILNNWRSNNTKVDFYLIKGIVENLLDYLGFKNRYTFIADNIVNMHPGIGARILLDREEIGIIGRVHPNINKDDIYIAELSMNKLIKKVKPLKYKEPSKYPEVKKDLAFIVKNGTLSSEIETVIKKAGGRLLKDITVFDVYRGENLNKDELSIAYSLTFSDENKTLSDEEVTKVFNNIINEVETKINAVLRDK